MFSLESEKNRFFGLYGPIQHTLTLIIKKIIIIAAFKSQYLANCKDFHQIIQAYLNLKLPFPWISVSAKNAHVLLTDWCTDDVTVNILRFSVFVRLKNCLAAPLFWRTRSISPCASEQISCGFICTFSSNICQNENSSKWLFQLLTRAQQN